MTPEKRILGRSAGRARGNPTAVESRRRMSPSEKAKEAPPADLLWHVHIGGLETKFNPWWAWFVVGTVIVLVGAVTTVWLIWPGVVFQILAARLIESSSEHRLNRSYRIGQ